MTTTPMEKYYLKADHQAEWSEVTREQFTAAEQAAGFHSKFGSNHSATGGFRGSGMRGRVEYVTEQPRPEQAGGEPGDDVPCQRCEGIATTTVNTRHFGLEKLCEPCATNVRRDGQEVSERNDKMYSKSSRQTKQHIHTCMFCGQSGTGLGNEQHSTLVAQRERLIEIARDALRFREEMNGKCDHDEAMTKLCTQCEIQAVLTTVEQERGREGQR